MNFPNRRLVLSLSTCLKTQCPRNHANPMANKIIHHRHHYYGTNGNGTLTNFLTGTAYKNRPLNKELGESSIVMQEGTEFQEVPVAVIKSDLGKSVTVTLKGQGSSKPYIDLDPIEEAAFVEGFKNFHTPQQLLEILNQIPSQEVTPPVALSILTKLFELEETHFKFHIHGQAWTISSGSIETFTRMAIVSRLVDVIMVGNDPDHLIDALRVLKYDWRGGAQEQSASSEVDVESDESEIDISEESEPEDNNQSQSDKSLSPYREEQLSNYRSKLSDEILIRTTMGKLSLDQVIRAVIVLGELEQKFPTEVPKNFIDKMWIGILDKSSQITLGNITSAFRTLQYFKKSRRLVLSILEKKVLSNWIGLNSTHVADICEALLIFNNQSHKNSKGNLSSLPLGPNASNYWGIISNRLLNSLSRSINLNLHQVKEDELIKVLETFYILDFCDDAITKTLDKYMKAKSLKIENPNLISSVMNYTLKFKLRSKNILEGAAEYLIFHQGKNLTAPQFSAITKPFGILDYQPTNGFKFWGTVEKILNEKFIQLTPEEIISIFLSFVYIKKYPFNFIDRIFSPYFLDRLHSSEMDMSLLIKTRSQLKLLDTTLTLECGSKFCGPYLPRDFTARTVFFEGRIQRMINNLQDPLSYLFKKSTYKLETSVVLPNLPLNEMYIVDVIISNKTAPSLTSQPKKTESNPEGDENCKLDINAASKTEHLRNRINLRDNSARYFVPPKSLDLLGNGEEMIALLIHLPEHYSSNISGLDQCLIGSQVMRIRHLKLLGFTVVSLNYEKLAELRVTPNALLEYLTSQIDLAKSK